MSACGLRKPQLKATRQSYNAHWQPWDQPVLNWTVCYSACNSFQVTITHPQVDFSLFQSKQKRNMAAEGSFTQKSPAVSCSFVGPPKKWLFSPAVTVEFSKGLICMLSGLNCSTMASSEGIQDSIRWQLDRSTQPPPPCAVSMSFMACGKGTERNRDEDYGEMRRLASWNQQKLKKGNLWNTHLNYIRIKFWSSWAAGCHHQLRQPNVWWFYSLSSR